MKGRIRKPFKMDGQLYTNTGGLSSPERRSVNAYRLVTAALFPGTPVTYDQRFSVDGGEAARSDPNGAMHGIHVIYRGKAYVLCGPPFVLTAVPASIPAPTPTPSKTRPTRRREHKKSTSPSAPEHSPPSQLPITPRVKPTSPKPQQGLLFDL